MPKNPTMPLWGPYSKKYMGISRILGEIDNKNERSFATAARFDFIVHPTLWNSSTPVPNVTVPSAYHLWKCSTDYSFYSYRYELMWKDKVYADVSYSKINDEAYLARCELVNNTDLSQNAILNFFSSLEFPDTKEYYIKADNDNYRLLKANEYKEFSYNTVRPWENETPDGMFRGMFKDEEFYLGYGLGDRCDNAHVHYLGLKPFGCEAGDRVSYELNANGIPNPVLCLRYKTVTDGDAKFSLNGREIVLPNSADLTVIDLPYCENPTLVSLGTAGVELDFIAVKSENNNIEIVQEKHSYAPDIQTAKNGNGYTARLDYRYNDCCFFVSTGNPNTRFRTLESGCLEDALINRLSNGDHTYDDLKETFSGSFQRKTSDEGFFQNTLIKSIFIEPHTTHIEYAVISKGDFEPLSNEEYEKIYQHRSALAQDKPFNKAGEKYTLSTDILRATLLTNCVYPVYRHGENVIHHTPGKRWDSFYTWDSGFIGMGLLEFSKELCQYALDMYLCDDTNDDFCFLLHGSLVPTQFVEYLELLKRTNDKENLNFLYDKIKIYYEFLRGRTHNSTCAKFGNGLLTTYDYWYSCSGMDDYPAQVKMIADKAEEYSCPCLSTSQIIRAGKIMKMVASYLGREEDIKIYDADIESSTKALNELAWDEESGYFGYTMYDKDDVYLMRTEYGENWDKGFDGVYPLIAGAVDGERRQQLIEHIKNPNEMWSNAGVSAVDMSASYYFDDGYWNGNVWMSHQWFVWKTMLDNGDTDFAFEIANRALEMWKEETDFSYFTYECFGIKTKRGGWFHNFGGLSAPICIWANAYYKPSTVTTGLDVWTDYQRVTDNSAEISFKYFGNNEKYSMLVTLSDEFDYAVYLDGEKIDFNERRKGCIEITFDGNVKQGILKIERI
ncbi:MAG: MGH1-like glycoside hydrolase domain-containing protein [Eubacterium sp.]